MSSYSGDSNCSSRCIFNLCVQVKYAHSNALDFKLYAFCVSMSNACQRDMKTQLNGNYVDFSSSSLFIHNIHTYASPYEYVVCISIVFINTHTHAHTQNTYFNLHLFASQSFGWNVGAAFYFNLLLFLNHFMISVCWIFNSKYTASNCKLSIKLRCYSGKKEKSNSFCDI